MSKSTLKVLAVLTAKATDNIAKITNTEIAEAAGVSRRTVTTALSDLIASKAINRLSDGSDGKPSTYEILAGAVTAETPAPKAPRSRRATYRDGCSPDSQTEHAGHVLLTKFRIPHIHDVAYTRIDPRWIGDDRCDYLIGYRTVIECGDMLSGTKYAAGRKAKASQAASLGITIINIADVDSAIDMIPDQIGLRLHGGSDSVDGYTEQDIWDFAARFPALAGAVAGQIRRGPSVELSPDPRAVNTAPAPLPPDPGRANGAAPIPATVAPYTVMPVDEPVVSPEMEDILDAIGQPTRPHEDPKMDDYMWMLEKHGLDKAQAWAMAHPMIYLVADRSPPVTIDDADQTDTYDDESNQSDDSARLTP